jgi:hypothetical protein
MKRKSKNGARSRENLEFSGLFDGIPRNGASFYVFSFRFTKWRPRPRVCIFRGSRTFYSALVMPPQSEDRSPKFLRCSVPSAKVFFRFKTSYVKLFLVVILVFMSRVVGL